MTRIGLRPGMLRPTRRRRLLFAAAAALLAICCPRAQTAEPDRPPNVVFLLADDLGYGDLGCFGQKRIRTPHLDQMAAEGMRLVQHYSGNAVCAPSRCVLMTGFHPGHAFIRNNRPVKPEGQYPIPPATVTLAKLLKQHGYATGGFGKWGLGPPGSDGDPLAQGFDRFFGFNCQRVAHNYYPTYLWSDDERVPLANPDFPSRGRLPADADANDPASYRQYCGNHYAPDLIAEAALEFVRRHKDEPFFLYFPTTVPHLALQVPDDSLAEYAGKFPEKPYVGGRGYLPHRTPRAAYAAMVTRLDRDIGCIVALIQSLGLDEQTIFVFTSDNGPLYDELGGTDTEFFQSAGSLRGRKGSLYEGGIRVPCIVRWKGHVKPGTTSDYVSGFEDWLPTLLELIGVGGATPQELDGISIGQALLGKKQPPRAFLYREFPGYGGQQSVRMGDWKAVRQNLAPPRKGGRPDLTIRLYDLATDPGEAHDVAAAHPQIVQQIETIMRSEHSPSAEFPLKALDEL